MKNNNNKFPHKSTSDFFALGIKGAKASFLSHIYSYWRMSKYKLNGSSKQWFMQPYEVIAQTFNCSTRTIQSYIKYFCDKGWIEKETHRFASNNGGDIFKIQNAVYITITPKLLHEIGIKTKETAKEGAGHNDVNNETKPVRINKKNRDETKLQTNICSNNEKNFRSETEKTSASIYKYNYKLINNTISDTVSYQNGDKSESALLQSQFNTINHFLRQEVKEEVHDDIKDLLIGTFANLTFKHKKRFSNPKQLAAEYLFVFLNPKHHFSWAVDLKERNNNLAKLVRQNLWRTPKGFYKHCYLAAQFKKPIEIETDWQHQKRVEIAHANPITSIIQPQKQVMPVQNDVLTKLENKMHETANQIEQLSQQLYQVDAKADVYRIREQINEKKQHLEILWQEQARIESEGQGDGMAICA